MKVNKLIYMLAIPALFAVSCKKFLDVKPKGVIIAETLSDFEGILNGESIVNPFGLNNLLIYPTDDVHDASFNPQSQSSPKGNAYFWVEYINNSSVRPDLWADIYTQIANLNVVTEGVLSASSGSEQQKKQLYAEAMVSKAFNYFQLLAFFAPAYNSNTAATEYGVPYVNSTDVSKDVPDRPTLNAAYEQLISDVTLALPDLPVTNINNTRVTKDAAYGMLTRIYMSMGDYPNASKYADMILGTDRAKILDCADYNGGKLPPTNSSPEELWVRYSNNSSFTYSAELLSKYDLNNDLRIRLLATKRADGTYTYGSMESYNPNRGITYAEIFLDKAECLARAGQIDAALDIINNTIRKNRFLPAQYMPLTAATPEAALTLVLEERRRELAFKGTRWIDMKRLGNEGRMPQVRRIAKDGTTVLATLPAGSRAYTFQIPLMVQSFNAGMPLNKR